MEKRIINLINVASSIAFIAGIAITLLLWNREAPVSLASSAAVIISYALGFVAITTNFLSEKTKVTGRKLKDVAGGKNSETQDINAFSKTTSGNDYTYIGKEIDRITGGDESNITKSKKVLSFLCNEFKAGQGIVFRKTEDESPKLKVFSSYAFVGDQIPEEGLDLKDGLAGLAFSENRNIELNDITKDNIKVFSGLGQSAPNSIIILPITNNGEVKGVLEMSFFKPLEQDMKNSLQENLTKIGTIL